MFNLLIRGKNCVQYLEECIASLRRQTYNNWEATLLLDKPEDGSVELAERLIKEFDEHGNKIRLYQPRKRSWGLGRAIWEGMVRIDDRMNERDVQGSYDIKSTAPAVQEDRIVAMLDADDYLRDDALSIVAKMYLKYPKTLFTYGSYIKMSKMRKTKTSKPYKWAGPRKLKWKGSHLKTWRFELWEHFPKEYLQSPHGLWAEAASDRALAYGLMELAGFDRCKHVPEPIYYYRDKTPFTTNVEKGRKWDKIFRELKPLERVNGL